MGAAARRAGRHRQRPARAGRGLRHRHRRPPGGRERRRLGPGRRAGPQRRHAARRPRRGGHHRPAHRMATGRRRAAAVSRWIVRCGGLRAGDPVLRRSGRRGPGDAPGPGAGRTCRRQRLPADPVRARPTSRWPASWSVISDATPRRSCGRRFPTGRSVASAAQFSRAGFADVRVTIDVWPLRYPSPAEFLRREASGSPLAGPVGAMDPARRDALLSDLAEAVADHVDDDGVACPIEVYVAVARR